MEFSEDKTVLKKIRKAISHYLRHNLEIPRGPDTISVKISDLLAFLGNNGLKITEKELCSVVAWDRLGRFFITGDWICATYGYNIKLMPELIGNEVRPVDILYYKVSKYDKPEMRVILPIRNRNCVFLLSHKEAQKSKDKNKGRKYWKIDAKKMYLDGEKFIRNCFLYMVKAIDKKYVME